VTGRHVTLTGKMATLQNVREAECQYRERNAYLDPYRIPIAPHKILRSQFPPCSVCFPQRLVGARELPAVCQCGSKSKREALQYATSYSPDPQEILPSDDHIKVSGGHEHCWVCPFHKLTFCQIIREVYLRKILTFYTVTAIMSPICWSHFVKVTSR